MSNERPILPAWAVIDDTDGRMVFIHLERGPAVAIAQRTATMTVRRLVRGWFRLHADDADTASTTPPGRAPGAQRVVLEADPSFRKRR